MPSNADLHEIAVANYMQEVGAGLYECTRPVASTSYSDIKVIGPGGNKAWVEVKMNHTDNLYNARVHFKDGVFIPTGGKDSSTRQWVLKELNSNVDVKRWINDLKAYLNRDKVDIITRTKAGSSELRTRNEEDKDGYPFESKKSSDLVSYPEMDSYLRKQGNAYLFKKQGFDITKLVEKHYTEGNSEPAQYIQTGADFLLLGGSNPLGLVDIPRFGAMGNFAMRIGMRRSGEGMEIQPELKISKIRTKSTFGVDPRKPKNNPLLV